MMLRLLFSQFGSSPPSSIQFDKAQIEFWLDSTENVMLKMRAELQAQDTVTAEQIAASMTLDIQNVDNVTLALPEDVRRAAMAGIIKPDFAADIIVVGEGPAAEQRSARLLLLLSKGWA